MQGFSKLKDEKLCVIFFILKYVVMWMTQGKWKTIREFKRKYSPTAINKALLINLCKWAIPKPVKSFALTSKWAHFSVYEKWNKFEVNMPCPWHIYFKKSILKAIYIYSLWLPLFQNKTAIKTLKKLNEEMFHCWRSITRILRECGHMWMWQARITKKSSQIPKTLGT